MGDNNLFTEYNQDAVSLAQALLGKVICYDKGTEKIKYLITVTEAYPASDCYSYVNRDEKRTGFGYNCLIPEEMRNKTKYHDNIQNAPGKCFIVSNAIHILGSLANNQRYNHVLIRGGIRLDKNECLVIEKPKMNFVIGEPITLCQEKLKIEESSITYNLKGEKSKLFIEFYNNISNTETLQRKRYKLKPNDKDVNTPKAIDNHYRYFIIPFGTYKNGQEEDK